MNLLAVSMSSSYRLIRVAAVVLACPLYCQHAAFSNEAASEPSSATVEKAAEGTDSDDPATVAELKRHRGTVTIASVLLVGICIVGLSLIWMVMVWGRRVRRFARQQLPGRTVVDELWYLKPPKPTVEPRAGDRPGLDANSNETPSR